MSWLLSATDICGKFGPDEGVEIDIASCVFALIIAPGKSSFPNYTTLPGLLSLGIREIASLELGTASLFYGVLIGRAFKGGRVFPRDRIREKWPRATPDTLTMYHSRKISPSVGGEPS